MIGLLGCSGPDAEPGILFLEDAWNDETVVGFGISTTEVPPGTDVEIDWSMLTSDFGGVEVLAGDIDLVNLYRFDSLDGDEIAARWAEDSFTTQDSDLHASFSNGAGASSARLTEFVVPPGNDFRPPDMFTSTTATWLLEFVTGAMRVRTVHLLRIVEGGGERVTIDDASATLVTTTLHAGTLQVPADTAEVDWSRLTTRADGAPMDLSRIDALEAGPLDIAVYGRTRIDLAAEEGFPGFAGIEYIALRCSSCHLPLWAYYAELAGP